jgi:hypothetical protein
VHRRGETVDVLLRRPEDVQSKPLRALGADAREAVELVDESLDDRRKAQVF